MQNTNNPYNKSYLVAGITTVIIGIVLGIGVIIFNLNKYLTDVNKYTYNDKIALERKMTSNDTEYDNYVTKIESLKIEKQTLQKELSELPKTSNNSTKYLELEKKIDSSILGVSLPAIFTGQYLNSAPIYQKIIEIDGLPNNTDKTISTGIDNADYIWIDQSNSFAFNAGASYPIPYKDPRVSTIGISARIINKGQNIIVSTGNDWNGYSGIVTVKYTMR